MYGRITKIITLTLALGTTLLVTNAVAGTAGPPQLITPEPISTTLFVVGSATFGIIKFMNKKNNSKRGK